MIGTTISHYRILEKLGEGGMGVVYKAHDVKLERTVALKFLPHHLIATSEEQSRFQQEARAAAVLNHSNICTIYDIAQVEDRQFIVMEFVDGRTLRDRLPISRTPDAIAYAIQIGEALREAHSNGIVHRDIKADNIMINAKDQVKILDFGLAKLKGSLKLTKTSSTLGTLAYMAPEQIQGGEVDARSDIFSFGVVLHEMLTGTRPFRGDHEAAMMYSILNEEPESLVTRIPDASPELQHILNRALEKNPDDRYQTVTEMVIDLRRLKKETSKVIRTISAASPPPIKGQRGAIWRDKRLLTGAGLAVVALAVAVSAILVLSSPAPSGKIPVAVISFENQTGEARYDYLRAAIPNLLITSLEQSRYLQVMSWERMRDLIRQLGKERTSLIDTDLGFEICTKDSVRAIIVGSFVKAGDMFATDVKVIDVRSKQLLRSAGSRGEGVASILKTQIDDLSKQIAAGIGLPEEAIRSEQRPVEEVTTSSIEAYEQYVKGRLAYDNWDHELATEYFEQAVKIDTSFAFAYRYLAASLNYLGLREARNEAVRKAYRHAHKATELERLYIEERYAWVIEHDRQKQVRILQEIAEKYPNDKEIHLALGIYYYHDDEFEKSVAALTKVLALDPNDAEAHNQMGYTYAKMGDFEKGLTSLDHYDALLPDSPNPHDSRGEIFVAMGWYDRAIAEFDQALAINPRFFPAYYREAYVLALQEQYKRANALIDRAFATIETPGQRSECEHWRAFAAYWAGRSNEALEHVLESQRLAKEAGATLLESACDWWKASIYCSQANLRLGRVHYERFAESLPAIRPDLPVWKRVVVAISEALIALQVLDAEKARMQLDTIAHDLSTVEDVMRPLAIYYHGKLLQEILLLEGRYQQCIDVKRDPHIVPIIGNLVSFPLTYLNLPLLDDQVARAYAGLNDRKAAIREYEAIIRRDPERNSHLLIHPLYHDRLAKLYEQEGMMQEAISQDERFLEFWGKADAAHREPSEARKRLASLRKVKYQ